VSRKAQVITPEMAKAERARREKARRRLVEFSEYVAPFYKAARHHRLVAEKLEQVERYIATKGKEGIGRLMIFEPPRHGKSEQVSRLFPAWLLGRQPDARIILTAYGADLAGADSKKVRDYVTSDRYKAIFGALGTLEVPVELSNDSTAQNAWDLALPNRGGVVAAGIGGGITGKGANLLVIDDPFKNRDDAESEAYRKRVMSWYKSSAYQRLEDGAAVVITHTRWHPEDLAGQMLRTMAEDPLLADQWEVVFLPALALKEEEYCHNEEEFQKNLGQGVYLPQSDPLGRKPGQALWPEKYNEAALAKIQFNVGDYDFASLDQQLPRPVTGGFFDEQDFKIIGPEKVPGKLRWFRYVDLALGRTQASDWNATVAVAMDGEGNVYYRDMLRVHELNEFLKQLAEWMLSPAEKGVTWGIESNNFQTLVFRELIKEKKFAAIPIVAIDAEDDKVSDARPLQTRAKQGLVYLVKGPWVKEFIVEAKAFFSGPHDDQVDTASKGLKMIAEPGTTRMYVAKGKQ
jgi:predicted phage terminase large subunit-like protein